MCVARLSGRGFVSQRRRETVIVERDMAGVSPSFHVSTARRAHGDTWKRIPSHAQAANDFGIFTSFYYILN